MEERISPIDLETPERICESQGPNRAERRAERALVPRKKRDFQDSVRRVLKVRVDSYWVFHDDPKVVVQVTAIAKDTELTVTYRNCLNDEQYCRSIIGFTEMYTRIPI